MVGHRDRRTWACRSSARRVKFFKRQANKLLPRSKKSIEHTLVRLDRSNLFSLQGVTMGRTEPGQSTHLQVQRQLGYDELIEAHALGFRFAGEGGMKGLGQAHVEFSAVLVPLRTDRRFG